MGTDASDALVASGLASAETGKALGKIEKIVGGISGISGYISGAKSLLVMAGILDEENELKDQLNEINNKLDRLFKFIAAQEELQAKMAKMLSVATFSGELHSAVIDLKHYVEDPDNPNYNRAAIFAVPLRIVEILNPPLGNEGFSGYWLRIYGGLIEEFSSPWMGTLSPIDVEGGMVMEWRLPLSVYLQAICTRLLMLQALEPDYRNNKLYREEISGYAQRLLFVHNKIVRDGFQGIRPPTIEEFIEGYVQSPPGPLAPTHSDWRFYESIYGVSEVYSGYRSVKKNYTLPASITNIGGRTSVLTWQQAAGLILMLRAETLNYVAIPHDGSIAKDVYDDYVAFRRRHIVKTMAECQYIYNSLGLNSLIGTINHLRDLAGEAPVDYWPGTLKNLLNIDNLEFWNSYYPGQLCHCWSLSGVKGLIDRNYLNNYGESDKKTSIRNIAEMMGESNVGSFRELLT